MKENKECLHEKSTVSLVFKDGSITRRCDTCGQLFLQTARHK